jgi:hypothetical protein
MPLDGIGQELAVHSTGISNDDRDYWINVVYGKRHTHTTEKKFTSRD